MANPKESDGEYEEADPIAIPGVGVRWIFARRKDELAALDLEFGFSADGTVAETQKAFATLVSTGFQSRRGNDSLNYRSSIARELHLLTG